MGCCAAGLLVRIQEHGLKRSKCGAQEGGTVLLGQERLHGGQELKECAKGGRSPNEDRHPSVQAFCMQGGADVVQRKLIFLDIDGPLAPWKNGKEHAWSASESLDVAPYRNHVDSLLRIINGAGGLEVVKVVISSNWRTDEDKYPWLVAQLRKHGIDVVGHTDVIRIYPACENNCILARNLEIQRALEFRTLGAKGPYLTETGRNAFEPLSLPASWEITSWVAIDDLDLSLPPVDGLSNIRFLSRFIELPTDPDKGNGWMLPPDNFAQGVRAWRKAFAKSHFVKVDSARGLGGTVSAEERAIKLLGSL